MCATDGCQYAQTVRTVIRQNKYLNWYLLILPSLFWCYCAPSTSNVGTFNGPTMGGAKPQCLRNQVRLRNQLIHPLRLSTSVGGARSRLHVQHAVANSRPAQPLWGSCEKAPIVDQISKQNHGKDASCPSMHEQKFFKQLCFCDAINI